MSKLHSREHNLAVSRLNSTLHYYNGKSEKLDQAIRIAKAVMESAGNIADAFREQPEYPSGGVVMSDGSPWSIRSCPEVTCPEVDVEEKYFVWHQFHNIQNHKPLFPYE